MKKQKILISICLVFAILTSVISPVMAENGPAEKDSFICFIDYAGDNDIKMIYSEGEIDNTVMEGATYDKTTNTLTLDNVKTRYVLWADFMGEDLNINLVGDNQIGGIGADSRQYNTYITITGNGSLIVNKDKYEQEAFYFLGGKIIVDESVTLKAYAPETMEYYDEYTPRVAYMYDSDIENGNNAFVFKNRNTPIVKSEEIIDERTIYVKGFGLRNIMFDMNYVLEKEGKYYGALLDPYNNYRVCPGEIKYESVNDAYYVDDSKYDCALVEYENLEELEAAGYTITDKNEMLPRLTLNGYYETYTDEEGNLYSIYSESGSQTTYYIYEITDETITLEDGETYTILKDYKQVILDNSANIEEEEGLTKRITSTPTNTYIHTIEQASLILNPVGYKFIEGENATFILGKDEVTFEIDADYSLFEDGGKVYVDDEEIDAFTSKAGSTIITLNDEFVKTLKEGEHTLKVAFNNGANSITKFTIERENEEKISNPPTGDNISIWINLMLISVFGIIGSVTIKKNNK